MQRDGEITGGAIAGIVIGCVLGIAGLVAALAVVAYYKRRQRVREAAAHATRQARQSRARQRHQQRAEEAETSEHPEALPSNYQEIFGNLPPTQGNVIIRNHGELRDLKDIVVRVELVDTEEPSEDYTSSEMVSCPPSLSAATENYGNNFSLIQRAFNNSMATSRGLSMPSSYANQVSYHVQEPRPEGDVTGSYADASGPTDGLPPRAATVDPQARNIKKPFTQRQPLLVPRDAMREKSANTVLPVYPLPDVSHGNHSGPLGPPSATSSSPHSEAASSKATSATPSTGGTPHPAVAASLPEGFPPLFPQRPQEPVRQREERLLQPSHDAAKKKKKQVIKVRRHHRLRPAEAGGFIVYDKSGNFVREEGSGEAAAAAAAAEEEAKAQKKNDFYFFEKMSSLALYGRAAYEPNIIASDPAPATSSSSYSSPSSSSSSSSSEFSKSGSQPVEDVTPLPAADGGPPSAKSNSNFSTPLTLTRTVAGGSSFPAVVNADDGENGGKSSSQRSK